MELSLTMKLRIAAVIAVGAAIIGVLAWPLAQPSEPFAAVLASNITLGGKITLAGLAFLTGLLAYFLSWPYGREIGIMAVPAGLAVWGARSGNMANLIQLNPAPEQRQVLFAVIKWEPFFWLAIISAGFAGVLLAQKICSKTEEKTESRKNTYLNMVIALFASVLIAQFFITMFAQDIKIPDHRLGLIVGQPAIGQVIFALLMAFGITAFLCKKFLNSSYIWPTLASAFIIPFVSIAYLRTDIVQDLAHRFPANFFSNPAAAILPVQMVAIGALGSIAGYWMAIRYEYWRENESK